MFKKKVLGGVFPTKEKCSDYRESLWSPLFWVSELLSGRANGATTPAVM